MRALSDQEKRTIRIGAIGLATYLAIFGGAQIARGLTRQRAEYQRLVLEAETLKSQMQLYQDRTVLIKKLMEGFRFDPARLSRTTLVAQASAAIQQTARTSGVMIGVVRESAGRSSNKELATMQMEANGPVPGLLKFIQQMESVGFPVLVESLQFTSDPMRPGPAKMNLVVSVLDFEQWKKTQVPNAASN